MTKDPVRDLINENFKLPRTLDLYKELLGKTQIEIYKKEDYVIQRLVKGDPKIDIIKTLKEQHPEGSFSYDDIDKFIERSDEIHQILRIDRGSLAKRWFKAKANLMEELAQIAVYTKGLIPRLQEQGDNTNTLKAIQTFQSILLNVAEFEGFRNPGQQVNIQVNNELDRVDEIRNKLRQKAHHADFVVDTKQNDKVPTEQKQNTENQNADSKAV